MEEHNIKINLLNKLIDFYELNVGDFNFTIDFEDEETRKKALEIIDSHFQKYAVKGNKITVFLED